MPEQEKTGYSDLWVPSQNGAFLLCLQPHSRLVSVCVMVNLFGLNSVVLCEPSQKGCFADLPQLHHQ